MNESVTLHSVPLENFLIEFSSMLVAQPFLLPNDASPETKRNLQTSIMETCRYHLAGFSKLQIIEEVFPQASSDTASRLYDLVVGTMGEVSLTDPKSGESFTPAVWDASSVFEIKPGFRSIDFARMGALCKPMMAYVEGDYKTCMESARFGADAFGRHGFYQFNIIAAQRLGRQDVANEAIIAAKNGTQISRWHFYLALVTAGEQNPEDLEKKAPDSSSRHQVRCFQGARALTIGEKEKAKAVLTTAQWIPTDFVTEKMIVEADLKRC